MRRTPLDVASAMLPSTLVLAVARVVAVRFRHRQRDQVNRLRARAAIASVFAAVVVALGIPPERPPKIISRSREAARRPEGVGGAPGASGASRVGLRPPNRRLARATSFDQSSHLPRVALRRTYLWRLAALTELGIAVREQGQG